MRQLVAYLITGLLFCGLISCEDDKKNTAPDDKEDQEIQLNDGYFVLCRGNEGMNNATLGFYDLTTDEYEKDIYSKQNGEILGELAQEMLIYGSKIYITVFGSNTVLVTNLNGKRITSLTINNNNEPVGPRSLAANDGKVFVGYFKGHAVGVLDTTSLSITKTINVGRYPEQMAVNKGKLYVTNSGGLDYEQGYANTVSIINISSLEEETKLEVAINPTKIVSDGKNNIYVASMGAYTDETNALQKIDPETGEVEKIGNASLITLVNNKLYTIYSQYDPETWELRPAEYISYNAQTGVQDGDKYIKDTVVGNPYSLNVDPVNGDIYISHFVWQETNDLYIFNKEGEKRDVLDVKGYDVAGIWFRP